MKNRWKRLIHLVRNMDYSVPASEGEPKLCNPHAAGNRNEYFIKRPLKQFSDRLFFFAPQEDKHSEDDILHDTELIRSMERTLAHP